MTDIAKALEGLSPEKRELLQLLMQKEGVGAPNPRRIPRRAGSATAPLSHAQKALWFLQQLEPDNAAYNISTAMRVRSVVNVPALRHAFQQLVNRHASLRTTFGMQDGVPFQHVHAQREVWFQEVTAAGWDEPRLYDYLVTEARRPFDLERGPLMRVTLVSRGEGEHVLLMVFHHIITDLWSLVVLTRELASLYQAETEGQTGSLPEVELEYTDYVHWQAEVLAGTEGERHWAYWQQQLAGELPMLALPTDRPRPLSQTYNGASHAIRLGRETTQALKALAQEHGATTYMLLLAAYAVLLHRYSGQDDILIGSPTSGRTVPEVAQVVGNFVNTLVLRTDVSGDPPFKTFLARVRQTVLDGFEHQEFPFALLTERLHPVRDVSRSPIFQTMFVLQKSQSSDQQDLAGFVQGDTDARMNIGGLAVEFMPVYKRTSQFDLRLTVAEVDGDLSASVNYNTDLFDAATVERMLTHYRVLVEAITRDPSQAVSKLPLLTEQERHRLLVEWNQTSSWYPRDKRITDVLEEQAGRTPNAVAIVFEDQPLTYRELHERANRLAQYLRRRGVGPEVFVGICVERSLDMVVGLLGILKAGGAYVPLDPNHPEERMRFMLEDAGVRLVVAHQEFAERLASPGVDVLCLDKEWPAVAQESVELPHNPAAAANAAYVIYTSGSTGKPKGVVLEHRSTVALIYWARTVFTDEDLGCVLASATINFDCSVFELFVPLGWGGKIILARNALELPSLPGASEITLLNTVPSSMVELLKAKGVPESVRTVNLSGDAISRQLVSEVYRLDHVRRVHSGYGPTEDTTFTTFGLVEREAAVPPPIGRPINNEQVYLLDRQLTPVPIGVPGELFIGGAGIARGYLNRPELTAEKFTPDPFSSEPGARLYRTGDLARYRPDGDIEFVGRIDHQVKIRGYRVELAEVEAALARHPGLRHSVVMAREDPPGVKRLIAYVVPDRAVTITTSELRSFMSQRVPEYMVPASFVIMDALPMTSGCKVDRRALPVPTPTRPDLDKEFVAPRDAVEEQLAGIWRQVLGLDRVGVFDNFFDLGGDSILSIQVVARATQSGLRLTAKQFFQHPTIAELATVVGTAPVVEAEQGVVTGTLPLTPIQHWFFEQNLPEPNHWNLAMLLEAHEPLEPSLLGKAVEHLCWHHDALRLRFTRGEARWEQMLVGTIEPTPFSVVDVSGVPAAEQPAAITRAATALHASLNLAEGPLLRVAYFHLGAEAPARLLLIVHHLAVDGVSWRILLEDLQAVYRQLERGHEPQLPPKTSSVKHWAEQLREYAQSERLRDELPYWLSRTGVQSAPLPQDFPAGENTAASARTVSSALEVEETGELLKNVLSSSRAQMNDILLTAVTRAFARWTGETALLINLEGHGREELTATIDLSRTVGWFTTIFPVLVDLGHATTAAQALHRVRRQLRQVPRKGIGYGVLRYLGGADIADRVKAEGQPEVSFNYLGQFDQVLTGAAFRPAAESIGPSRSSAGSRQHVIDITGRVVEGRLTVVWAYSENLHRRETIEQLASAFLAELRSLMAEAATPAETQPGVAPRTPTEEGIAAVWAEVLKQDSVGVYEDFFDLGGDWVNAQRVLAMLQTAFEVEIPWASFLAAPTVAGLALTIDELLLREIEGLTEEEVQQLLTSEEF